MMAFWFSFLVIMLIIILGALSIGSENYAQCVNSPNLTTSDISRAFNETRYPMKLYLIHCGFYDPNLCGGLYEGHVNFFVVANSFEDARAKAKLIPEFLAKKMHVDGLQEVVAVGGYRIELQESADLRGETVIRNHRHRDLAPKAQASSSQAVTT